MRSGLIQAVGLAAIVTIAACSGQSTGTNDKDATVEGNILLAEWTGPYGGVPAFDKMDIELLKPGVETAMAINLEEIDAIAGNPEPPTFDNTILEMERSGRDPDRVLTFAGIWRSNRSTPESREVFGELAPKLADHTTKITQNLALFERVKAIYEAAGASDQIDCDIFEGGHQWSGAKSFGWFEKWL